MPVFLGIGTRELSAVRPDSSWLSAVVHGLHSSTVPEGVEMLLTIFERQDLPGGLRGDAGDKLAEVCVLRSTTADERNSIDDAA